MSRSQFLPTTILVLIIEAIMAANGFAESNAPILLGDDALAVEMTAKSNPGEGRPPNILLILADDLGYNDISLNGNPIVATPNIDSLAREGARFVTGYTAHATCSPSRAALLTGRFPHRFGYEFIRTPDGFTKAFDGTYPTEDETEFRDLPPRLAEADAGLPDNEITIAELLKSAAYRTAIFGKWHLGSGRAHWPTTQGFDEFAGFPGGAAMYSPKDDHWSVEARLPWSGIDSYLWDNLRFMMVEDGKGKVPEAYVTDVLADRAIKFLNKTNENPFFIYLAFNAPHNPLDARKDAYDRLSYITDHKTRVYYAMIETMDAAIGRVLKALEDSGNAGNTLVIFTSDNGGAWYTHIPIHNLPYRGWKATFFEGGINVPFLVRWPDQIRPGQIITEPASGVDVFPTLAAAAEVNLPSDRVIDGVNLLPRLTSVEPLSERTLYWAAGGYRVIRKGDWKLQVQTDPKMIWLFNLAIDPTEQVNLATTHPEKVKEMSETLSKMHSEMAEPLWPSPYRIKMRIGPYIEPAFKNPEWVWSG